MKTVVIKRMLVTIGILFIVFAMYISFYGPSIVEETLGAYPSVLRHRGLEILTVVASISTQYQWSDDKGVDAQTSAQYFNTLRDRIVDEEDRRRFSENVVITNCSNRDMTLPEITSNTVLWSVLRNPLKEVTSNMPVLVTRNVDIPSLSSCISEKDMRQRVRFDNRYRNVLDYYACVIYADGQARVFKKSDGNGILYRDFYRETNLNVKSNGVIRFLTPIREIVLEAK